MPAWADEPPSYEDFIALKQLEPDSQDWRDLYESLAKWTVLTEEQIGTLTQSAPARVNAIVSHAAHHEINLSGLLNKALIGAGDDPLVLATTVNYCMGDMGESRDQPPFCAKLEEVIQSFQKIDANNSLPWYQMASLKFKQGKMQETLTNLQKGNGIGRYQSYYIPLFKELRSLVNTLNFSPYHANNFAFLNAVSILRFSHLKDMCSGKPPSKMTAALAGPCVKMGEAIETHSMTIIESLLGLAIQSNAYKAMGKDENSAHLQAIAKKRNALTDLWERATAVAEDSHTSSEEEALVFFSDLEKYGEAEAVRRGLEKLAK